MTDRMRIVFFRVVVICAVAIPINLGCGKAKTPVSSPEAPAIAPAIAGEEKPATAQVKNNPATTSDEKIASPTSVQPPPSTGAAIQRPNETAKPENKPGEEVAKAEQQHPTPKKVVFPSKRRFVHFGEFFTKDASGITSFRVATKTNDDLLMIVDLYVKNLDAKANTGTLLEAAQFTFSQEDEEWGRLKPKVITFIANGRPFDFECTKENRYLSTMLGLHEFAGLLRAKTLEVKIGETQFELVEGNLESLRDLASRVPDGNSVDGNFAITHEPDPSKERGPSDDKKTGSSTTAISIVRQKLMPELNDQIDKINDEKAALKKAMISGNLTVIASRKKQLKSFRVSYEGQLNHRFQSTPSTLMS